MLWSVPGHARRGFVWAAFHCLRRQRWRGAAPIEHQAELLAEQRILIVSAAHNQSSGAGAQLTYASCLRAEVFSFDVNSNPARLDILCELVRNVMAEALLTGEALRVQPGNSGKLGNSDQLLGSQIADPYTSTY